MPSSHNPTLKYLPFGIAAVAILAAMAISMSRRPAPLPVVSHVAPFALTNQWAQPVRRDDLQGKVWAANIIFTRCPGPCLRMTRAMREVQSTFARTPGVRFVSLTADPEFDTPDILKRYTSVEQAPPEGWWFLTGDKAGLVKLAVDDLKLTAVDKETADRESPDDLFIHSTISVVVDAQGRVRGSTEILEPGGPERLRELLLQLLGEARIPFVP